MSSDNLQGTTDETSDALFRVIAESSRDLILVLDHEGYVQWASPSHLPVLGRNPQELIGHHCAEFLHPDDREIQQQVFRKRIETRAPQRAELRVGHADGTWVLTESLGVPVVGDNGSIVNVVVTARDISERKSTEERIRMLVEQIPVNVWTADRNLILTSVQGGGLPFIGIAQSEALGKSIPELLAGDERLAAALEVHRRTLEGEVLAYETHWRGRDVIVRMHPLRGRTGRISGVIGVALDVTGQKLAERKYRTLFERNVAGVFQSTSDGKILECNAAFARIFGYSSPEQLLKVPSQALYFTAEDRDALLQLLRTRGEAINFEARLRRADGHPVWVLMNEVLVRHPSGEETLEGTVIDITDRKLAEERVEYQAFHDSLTGLPNRFLLNDRLTLSLVQSRRHKHATAVLFLDLDHFKLINDTMSHNAGDELLKAVATRLTAAIRGEDTVARIGGDEFVFVLPDIIPTTAAAAAARVAEKILDSIRAPVMINGREIFATGSIGIAISPADGDDTDTLIKNADSAMYRAKEMGRNTYQFHTPHAQRRAEVRLSLESGLRRALERDEFFIAYQPQISLATGRITGFEALIRWNRPGTGVVSPADFIPLAEEIGLIVPIGEWVLWTASQQMRTWHLLGYEDLRLAINLSPRQFQHEALTRMVENVLEETELPPASLELEITESLSIRDSDLTVGRLSHFRAMGISAALDDFGTGYSSLAHLRNLPIDTVKIDRSFIQDISDVSVDSTIVQAIVTMCHSLKLRVIAEGVERPDQQETLRRLRCDEMQGYVFSRPVTRDEAEELLRRERLASIPN